ncbi:hypothetical protein AWY79_03655 [Pseudodesulfovibrio indicus]|uniref:Uncharacterized protein n=1 Tax=Pseudodesulfovibrio indicus TaxID=1716143 RepID=A0ABN4LUP5_9BACT|nr:hypothetical protein AWY79_03655 [Pseudodesulfovibrio indicus]
MNGTSGYESHCLRLCLKGVPEESLRTDWPGMKAAVGAAGGDGCMRLRLKGVPEEGLSAGLGYAACGAPKTAPKSSLRVALPPRSGDKEFWRGEMGMGVQGEGEEGGTFCKRCPPLPLPPGRSLLPSAVGLEDSPTVGGPEADPG